MPSSADEHLGRALDAQPPPRSRADAERAQMMRQLVGARIELGVAEALLLEHHRDRVGRARGLRGEQLRQGGGRDRARGVVPRRAGCVRRSSAAENVEAADRPLRAPRPPPPAAGRAAPPAPRRWRGRTGRWRIRGRRRARPASRPARAARRAPPTGRTWRSRSPTGSKRAVSPGNARSSPARCSGTPASPGTADAAPATAPG